MEIIDMTEDVYEYNPDDFEEFIFNPITYTDEDGWIEELRYQLTDKFNYDDEIIRDDICSYSHDYLLTLKEKNKIQYSYFEYKYSQVLICLFNFKIYYDYQANYFKKQKVRIRSYTYIQRYLRDHGFTQFWEIEVSKNIRLDLPDYFKGDFSRFLGNKLVWEGTGLWDFIEKANLKYFFDSYDNPFDLCFHNYQETVEKYNRNCGDYRKTDDPGLYVPAECTHHEYEKRTEQW